MFDWVEALWTAIAIVGLVACIWESKIALENVRFLVDNNFNGKRKIVARGHLRREIFRGIIQAIFVFVGAAAMSTPPSPNPRSAALVGLLIVATVIINVNTLLDGADRRKLIDYWHNVDLSHVKDRENAVKNTAESLARIEAASEVVAENLAVAQKAVDEVAKDLAESHDRADAIEGDPGAAADASARSPDE